MTTETKSSPYASLALASLALGTASLLFSQFPVAALAGMTGAMLGIIHILRRQNEKTTAWMGIVFSVMGLGTGMFYNFWPQPAIMTEQERQYLDQMNHWKGVAAPDFTFTTLQGQKVKLSDLKGKRVVLDFWATWCPPCVQEIPHFIKLRQEHAGADLFLAGISQEDPNSLISFVQKNGIIYPIATLGEAPAPYQNVFLLPTTFFINRQGVIQDIAIGYHDFKELKKMALAADTDGAPSPPPDSAFENGTAGVKNSESGRQ